MEMYNVTFTSSHWHITTTVACNPDMGDDEIIYTADELIFHSTNGFAPMQYADMGVKVEPAGNAEEV